MGFNLISNDAQVAIRKAGNGAVYGQLPGQCIRIHTLGRFGIRIDGQTLTSDQLRQQKPVELLQSLIAFGGRGVNKELLSNALWPDAEGDDAANSFDVTLHRLRKLLKHDNALSASDGRLTLNNELVWVDAWAFERLLNQIDNLMQMPGPKSVGQRVTKILNHAMCLYQGGFLAREAARPWSLSLRERLRSKLIRSLMHVGRQAETNGEWVIASLFYQKGVEMDPLFEMFYQRLMVCYRQVGRKAEAITIYQRCCNNLSTGLRIAPSMETDQILHSL